MKLLSILLFVFLAGCSVEGTHSTTQEVFALETMVSCKAQWRCEGDFGYRGEVTSTRRFDENESRLCVLNLREQVAGLGLCGAKRSELILESINLAQNQVRRKVLTLATEDGAILMKLADEVKRLIRKKCDGDECYDYWNTLGRRYRELEKWRAFVVKKELLIAENIGKELHEVSSMICRVSHAGGDVWMDFLTEQTAIAGKALIELQVRARLNEIKTCSKLTGDHKF